MENFKRNFKAHQILGIIQSKKPPPKIWSIPPFLLTLPGCLENFMGKECFHIYSGLSKKDAKGALQYIETCGQEVSTLIKCPLWEDWNEKDFTINLENLKRLDLNLFNLVKLGLKK